MYLGKIPLYLKTMVNTTMTTGNMSLKEWKSPKPKDSSYVWFKLWKEKNDRPTLIKELSNINFVSLNVLNLSKISNDSESNKINSVEALSFIYFPNL